VPSTGDLHSYLQPRAGSPTSVHHKVVSHDATIRHKNKSTRLADGNEDSAAACQARPGSHDAARAGALGARPLERPGVALLAVSGRRGALGRQAGALAGGRALRRSGAAESQLLSTRRGEMGGQYTAPSPSAVSSLARSLQRSKSTREAPAGHQQCIKCFYSGFRT